MRRFRVIVTGTGMSIPPDGTPGFATTRFVRASDPQDAARQALALVEAAVDSEPAFATSPKPELQAHAVFPVSPLKRSRPNSGYTFIGEDATLEDALDLEIKAGSGWIL